MVAAAIVGAAVIGGVATNMAADKASSAQRDATESANRLQSSMYYQTRADQAPWRKAGVGALGQMSALTGPNGEFSRPFGMNDFQADPGYAFRLQQGQQALERSASARGGVLSGGALKGIDRFGQGMASQEYEAAYNRFMNNRSQRYNQLASLAGLGQTANGQLQQAGMNAANQMGNNYMNMGNGMAGAALAQGNAWQGALNQGMNGWMNYQMMQRMYPQSQPYTQMSTSQPWDTTLGGNGTPAFVGG